MFHHLLLLVLVSELLVSECIIWIVNVAVTMCGMTHFGYVSEYVW